MNKREWMLQAVLAGLHSGTQVDCDGLAEMYDAIIAATPDQADEGWIEHRGEKPYPEGMVDVQFRGGRTQEGTDADDFIWSHGYFDVPDEDIIAWRPARA